MGGVAGVATPLNFQKIVVIRVALAVVVDLVVTSSNNACLRALNSVTVSRKRHCNRE